MSQIINVSYWVKQAIRGRIKEIAQLWKKEWTLWSYQVRCNTWNSKWM